MMATALSILVLLICLIVAFDFHAKLRDSYRERRFYREQQIGIGILYTVLIGVILGIHFLNNYIDVQPIVMDSLFTLVGIAMAATEVLRVREARKPQPPFISPW